jgi:H/ACA ribonucleoprotein complex subunit 1
MIVMFEIMFFYPLPKRLKFFSEMGVFAHVCENEMVFKSTHKKIPKFNAPVYFENKSQVGVLDEIFGPMNEVVSF